MKNFFRLLALAGVMIFYSCNSDKKNGAAASDAHSKKDLLVGKWQLDSIDISYKKDTSELDFIIAYLLEEDHYKQVQFAFSKDGTLTEFDADSSKTNGRFEWLGDSAISLADTEPKEVFSIKKLDDKNLVFTTDDTVALFLKRIKQNK